MKAVLIRLLAPALAASLREVRLLTGVFSLRLTA